MEDNQSEDKVEEIIRKLKKDNNPGNSSIRLLEQLKIPQKLIRLLDMPENNAK